MTKQTQGHTPGPWEIGQMQYFGLEKVIKKHDLIPIQMGIFCGALVTSGAVSKDMQEANARLISAAPRLFELLKEEVQAKRNGDYGPLDSAQNEWLEDAEQIIAKAEDKDNG